MAHLTHKTTILLSDADYKLLSREGIATNKTLGELIREAISEVYRKVETKKVGKAWDGLFKAGAPVSSWDKMEAEIIKGRT